MELFYYWIDERTAYFKEIGMNFGRQIKATYEPTKKKLTIEKNMEYIEGLFDSDTSRSGKLTHVTGVIGKNGAGKTTLFEMLRGLFWDGGIYAKKPFKRIFIVRDISNEPNKYQVVFHKDLIGLEGESFNIVFGKEVDKEEFKIIPYDEKSETIEGRNKMQQIAVTKGVGEMSCVYYANQFDSNLDEYITEEDRNYYDISTKGIIRQIEEGKYRNQSAAGIKSKSYPNMTLKYPLPISRQYNIATIENKLAFFQDIQLRDRIKKEFDVSYPSQIGINLFDIDAYGCGMKPGMLTLGSRYTLRMNHAGISEFEKYVYNKVNYIGNDQKLTLKKTYLIRILDAYFQDIENIIGANNVETLVDVLRLCDDEKTLEELLRDFSEAIIKSEKLEVHIERQDIKGITESYIEFIQYFVDDFLNNNDVFEVSEGVIKAEQIGEGSVRVISEEVCLLIINLTDRGMAVASELVRRYKQLCTRNNIFAFSLTGMSSGEDSVMELFSRFYTLSEKIQTQDMVVLMDEGDTYFHPEWQRKFVKLLLWYLQRLFPEKNIHCIISSNTPFIVADLPKSNLIALDIETDETYHERHCRVGELKIENTFGANIYELYREGFFLNQIKGEFFLKVVNGILDELHDREKENKNYTLSEEETEVYRRKIEIIGDKLIKEKMLELLNEHETKESKAKRLKELETEKKRIEQEINKIRGRGNDTY